MIIESKGRTVIVRGRDNAGKRYEKSITGHWPYCFVRTEDAEYAAEGVAVEHGYTGLYGEELSKITCTSDYDVKQIAKREQTWEGNLPYVNQVMADYLSLIHI